MPHSREATSAGWCDPLAARSSSNRDVIRPGAQRSTCSSASDWFEPEASPRPGRTWRPGNGWRSKTERGWTWSGRGACSAGSHVTRASSFSLNDSRGRPSRRPRRHGLRGSATGGFATLELGATLVRAGRHLEGHALLADGLGPLRKVGEPLPVAEALLPTAEALRQLGRRRDARRALQEADSLIESMVDPGYLRIARDALVPVVGAPLPVENKQLSRRELEVLRLMATGRSKREVANELVVFVQHDPLALSIDLPEARCRGRRKPRSTGRMSWT